MKAVLPTLILATSISAGFISSAIAAQNSVGYLTDSSGHVVKNSYGLCWRTGSWTSAQATQECDPDLVAKAPAPHLVVASPPVAKAPVANTPHIAIPVVAPPAVTVTLSSDELFGFNRAEINPDQRSLLDAFIKTLAADNVESIAVTGPLTLSGVCFGYKRCMDMQPEASCLWRLSTLSA